MVQEGLGMAGHAGPHLCCCSHLPDSHVTIQKIAWHSAPLEGRKKVPLCLAAEEKLSFMTVAEGYDLPKR